MQAIEKQHYKHIYNKILFQKCSNEREVKVLYQSSLFKMN